MNQPTKIIIQNSRMIGFPGLLTLLFIAMKLTGYIGWSWAWVTAPLWLPLGVLVVASALFALFCLVMALIFN